jgi:urease accessory protein
MNRKLLLPLLALALPTLAHAHPGAGHVHGFSDGIAHPILGLDHLLALLAVGLWAAQLGGRALWAIPASFVGVMALGGILAMAGLHLPMVETGILTSVLLLGILVAFAIRPPLWAGAAVVGFFALFHGFAHGAEMPDQASSFLYATGFILATAGLHAVGIGLGIAAKKLPFAPALRIAGALILVGGVVLTAS